MTVGLSLSSGTNGVTMPNSKSCARRDAVITKSNRFATCAKQSCIVTRAIFQNLFEQLIMKTSLNPPFFQGGQGGDLPENHDLNFRAFGNFSAPPSDSSTFTVVNILGLSASPAERNWYSGFALPKITASSIITFSMLGCEGRSYMTSNNVFSTMERNPRAPVLRSIACFAT